MRPNFMFTSESVTSGHPDKLCDQISDAIVDRLLQQDPQSRVITECAISTGVLFLAARFDPNAAVDFTQVVRRVIDQVGYQQQEFNSRNCTILTSLEEAATAAQERFDTEHLSEADINAIPAQHQVTVFGYACNQTPELIPLPIGLAHRLARQLDAVRRDRLTYLEPDGSTQVGVEFRDAKPYRIHSLTVVASQNETDAPALDKLRQDIKEQVVCPVFEDQPLRPDDETHIFINPQGPLLKGGPVTHAGLTGRKNGIDTYGEYAKHSSAALSGKDPLRIDRVGAYAARHAAKNVVAAGLADECEVQLSYTIGLSRPVSVRVETFGTHKIPPDDIDRRLANYFEFRPAGIVQGFSLRALPAQSADGFFQRLAVYGHMGRPELDLPWERTDKVAALQE